MPSHLSSLGLPVNDQAEFAALANRIGPLATPLDVEHGVYWKWTSGCGASMWLQTNANDEFLGMTPFYAGKGRVRIRITSRVNREDDSPLEGAFHGWADPRNDESDGGAYPLVFDAVDFAVFAKLKLPAIVEAQITAFAHEIAVFSTEEAYQASQSEEMKFASKSFIPSGLFSVDGESHGPPQSTAIFTGHVLDAALKTNALTGAQYYWACVESLGGSYDVVFDPEICGTLPEVGGVIAGSFWLCGLILTTEVV